jgi:hypothetical protein
MRIDRPSIYLIIYICLSDAPSINVSYIYHKSILSIYLLITSYQSILCIYHESIHLSSTNLPILTTINQSIYLFIHQSTYLIYYLPILSTVYLSIQPSVHQRTLTLSIYFLTLQSLPTSLLKQPLITLNDVFISGSGEFISARCFHGTQASDAEQNGKPLECTAQTYFPILLIAQSRFLNDASRKLRSVHVY